MKLHRNARTCPNSRSLLVVRITEQGWSVSAAASAAGVSERTVYRWLARWRREGAEGLIDRSSRPDLPVFRVGRPAVAGREGAARRSPRGIGW